MGFSQRCLSSGLESIIIHGIALGCFCNIDEIRGRMYYPLQWITGKGTEVTTETRELQGLIKIKNHDMNKFTLLCFNKNIDFYFLYRIFYFTSYDFR